MAPHRSSHVCLSCGSRYKRVLAQAPAADETLPQSNPGPGVVRCGLLNEAVKGHLGGGDGYKVMAERVYMDLSVAMSMERRGDGGRSRVWQKAKCSPPLKSSSSSSFLLCQLDSSAGSSSGSPSSSSSVKVGACSGFSQARHRKSGDGGFSGPGLEGSTKTKGHKVLRAQTTKPSNKKVYAGTLPLCNKCKFHHNGQCTVKSAKLQESWPLDPRLRDCPELKNRNHGNQFGVNEARILMYALGGGRKAIKTQQHGS
ncbi:hypothetical protein Tco_1069768 [Tanacetum coccineum]|uniref:Uncharacterized protein n=1 Tax=Tanacetum coccineum TaxID=301880 RepID=A0ABQ5HJH6_9ASTR